MCSLHAVLLRPSLLRERQLHLLPPAAHSAHTSATSPLSSTPVAGSAVALVRPWASWKVASCRVQQVQGSPCKPAIKALLHCSRAPQPAFCPGIRRLVTHLLCLDVAVEHSGQVVVLAGRLAQGALGRLAGRHAHAAVVGKEHVDALCHTCGRFGGGASFSQQQLAAAHELVVGACKRRARLRCWSMHGVCCQLTTSASWSHS